MKRVTGSDRIGDRGKDTKTKSVKELLKGHALHPVDVPDGAKRVLVLVRTSFPDGGKSWKISSTHPRDMPTLSALEEVRQAILDSLLEEWG